MAEQTSLTQLNADGQGKPMGLGEQKAAALANLKQRLQIQKMTMRFPLTEIQRESEEYREEVI